MKKGQINVGYKARRIAYNNTEKLIGSAERYSTIDYGAIVAYAAKAAAVPESSIEMAMEALFDAMNYFVLNGHSVQIPNLGTFSLGIKCKSSESETEFTANFSQNLRSIAIRFLPDTELKAMIASTAINTSLDSDGYTDNGVIAVKSMFLGQGSNPIAINAGRTYRIDDISRLVINGTRLSKTYLGPTPISITVVDDDGTQHSSLVAGKMLALSYAQINVSIKLLKEFHPNAKYLGGFVLKDINGNVIVERTFGYAQNDPYISAVSVNNSPMAVGATAPYVADEAVKVKIYGDNLADATVIKAGALDITPTLVSDTVIIGTFTPPTTGNYPIQVKSATSEACVYNLSFGSEGGVVVTTVTANGDALNNGGTTNITAGSNYNISVAGTGLDNLTAADFTLPAGSLLTITSQSATLIAAVISNTQAGDFKISYAGNDIFVAGLVAVTPTVSVTGWKATQQGATQALTTAVTANPTTKVFEVYLVGNNTDDLTTASFSGTGLSEVAYTPASGLLHGKVTNVSTSVVITANSTTIATLNVHWDDSDDENT